ncbi:unnamed protein product [Auanema sp. JU1783]|nr:unnamed protein product [Auanema sp. JU1783]
MAFLGYGALAALGGAIVYANLPTRLTIGAVAPAASYLAQAKLFPIKDDTAVEENKEFEASQLFKGGPTMVMAVRRPGCLLCRREAARLSDLLPEMKNAGIELVGVVHETKGVKDFQPYFKGNIYFDSEKRFYGPNQRWMPLWMGFLRVGTYMNVYKSKKEGFEGNTAGEGRLLGGVYLIANNEIVWHHLEKEWGDAANIEEVREAIRKFK